MMRLLHVSDLHFGEPYLPEVGEAVLRIAPTLNVDAVVVSGDLTQRAKVSEFADAKAFLEKLPAAPQIIVPGNHDVPLYRVAERWRDPHGNYRRVIQDELNQVHTFEHGVFAAVDSTAPRQSIVNGRIHPGQLEFCEQAFQGEPPDKPRVVVAHHHFAPAPDYEYDQVMPQSKRAINRFVDMEVDVIMGGHLHRAYIGNTLDIYAGRHRERGIIIVQCGTTTSRRGRGREREKNSFNLVELGYQMVKVTHYMYFSETGDFAPVSRHELPRPGRPFVDVAAEDESSIGP